MTQAGERPDVAAAIARMGWKFGGRRELRKLSEHLHAGETVRFIAQGTYENDEGIVVLTDQRLLFLFHGVMRQRLEDFPLRLITSVQTKSSLSRGEMKVFLSGNAAVISRVLKSDLDPLANSVRQGMAAQHSSSRAESASPLPAVQAGPDPMDQLARLAKLREAGILTEAEYAAKKAELLGRI